MDNYLSNYYCIIYYHLNRCSAIHPELRNYFEAKKKLSPYLVLELTLHAILIPFSLLQIPWLNPRSFSHCV